MAATPRYHYAPERGRFGDPKPFFWQGRYHVFFQNSPAADEAADEGSVFAGMRWAHVASEDLIHWERLDDALVPTPGGPDAFGCWTGCVLRADGVFHIFYTGVGGDGGLRQTVCHATSDDLVTWRKDPANPLVAAQPPFATRPASAWRDPQVVRAADGGWDMVLTADLPDAPEALRGCVARLSSDDLATWRVAGLEHHPKSVHRCECPDTFPLGKGHVLLYSDFGVQVRHARGPRGPWQRPDVSQLDDFRYYAAKTTVDGAGRRLMFGFLFGRAADQGTPTDSSPWEWGGSMALPRELDVNDEGHLLVRPAGELDRMRQARLPHPTRSPLEIGRWTVTPEDPGDGRPVRVTAERTRPDEELILRLMGEHPAQAELDMDLQLAPNDAASVLIGCNPDLSRGYRLEVDRAARQISFSRVLPHQNPASKVLQQMALPSTLPERQRLRAYLDGSVLEVFLADRLTFSCRLYDPAEGPTWWGLATSSDALVAERVTAWRLGG